MRLETCKNFISAQEVAELNAWADKGVVEGWLGPGFDRGRSGYANRVTTRIFSDRFTNPEFVLNLSSRVRAYCGVADQKIITGHGRDGVVVSCTFPGGDVYAHCDPRNAEGLSALRCNILTRASDSGGVLHLGGTPHPLEVGELHCYLASEHEHYVSEVVGSTARVLWMFGAYVPKKDWDSGQIKFSA